MRILRVAAPAVRGSNVGNESRPAQRAPSEPTADETTKSLRFMPSSLRMSPIQPRTCFPRCLAAVLRPAFRPVPRRLLARDEFRIFRRLIGEHRGQGRVMLQIVEDNLVIR